MRRFGLILGFLLLAALLAYASTSNLSGDVHLTAIGCDLGEIPQSHAYKATFALKNNFDCPLAITRLRPSCKCTSILSSASTLAAHSTAPLTVSIDLSEADASTKSPRRAVSIPILVEYDARGRHLRETIVLTGTIVQKIRVHTPFRRSNTSAFEAASGAEIGRAVISTSGQNQELQARIAGDPVSEDELPFQVELSRTDSRTSLLRVLAKRSLMAGLYQGRVVISAPDAPSEQVTVPFVFAVDSEFSVIPSAIICDNIAGDHIALRIRGSKRPFIVEDATCPDGVKLTSSSPEELSYNHQFTVDYAPHRSWRPGDAVYLRAICDNGNQETIRIPIVLSAFFSRSPSPKRD